MLRTLLRARANGWPEPPPPLAPAHVVNKWMADAQMVGDDLNMLERTSMWMSLRLLPHLGRNVQAELAPSPRSRLPQRSLTRKVAHGHPARCSQTWSTS